MSYFTLLYSLVYYLLFKRKLYGLITSVREERAVFSAIVYS